MTSLDEIKQYWALVLPDGTPSVEHIKWLIARVEELEKGPFNIDGHPCVKCGKFYPCGDDCGYDGEGPIICEACEVS